MGVRGTDSSRRTVLSLCFLLYPLRRTVLHQFSIESTFNKWQLTVVYQHGSVLSPTNPTQPLSVPTTHNQQSHQPAHFTNSTSTSTTICTSPTHRYTPSQPSPLTSYQGFLPEQSALQPAETANTKQTPLSSQPRKSSDVRSGVPGVSINGDHNVSFMYL